MVARTKQGAMPVKGKPEVQRVAYSVDEFCAAHGFTRPTYYELEKRGEGPRTFRVGRRKLISVEAAAEWRRQREAQSRAA